LSDFNKTWIVLTDLKKKSSNTKFYENLPCGSGTVPCGQADRQTDRTKLTVVFHNVAITPTNLTSYMGCKWRQNYDSHILSTKLYICHRSYAHWT